MKTKSAEIQNDAARYLGFLRRANEWYQSAGKLSLELSESESPLPADVDSLITIAPRLTACENNIKYLTGLLAIAGKPAPNNLRHFWCDYHSPSEPIGPRRWEKISDSVWEERRGDQAPAVYDVIGPNKDPLHPGILLRSKDEKSEALIPATVAAGEEAYLKVRVVDQTQWRTVSLIYLEE